MHARSVLSVNDDFPIETQLPVHSGKVRSVYWLTAATSRRLIEQKGYPVAIDTPLAVMIISDRLSAFDCVWHAEEGLAGVPGKGAALNAIANHWFDLFKQHGLAKSHIVDVPHPLVWIVQKARPILIEGIARQYITGSMWRDYQQGQRVFCGLTLPANLTAHQKLDQLMVTPSTKGIIRGVADIVEADDVNISRQQILANFSLFGFQSKADVDQYEALLKSGFALISSSLAQLDQLFVDTKFEFGYVQNAQGQSEMIYIDEVGTPDSSRIWDAKAYAKNQVIENSKEGFRQSLLNYVADPDILLNKDRFKERQLLAEKTDLPLEMMMQVATTYQTIAEKIIGEKLALPDDPRAEIIASLHDSYQIIV